MLIVMIDHVWEHIGKVGWICRFLHKIQLNRAALAGWRWVLTRVFLVLNSGEETAEPAARPLTHFAQMRQNTKARIASGSALIKAKQTTNIKDAVHETIVNHDLSLPWTNVGGEGVSLCKHCSIHLLEWKKDKWGNVLEPVDLSLRFAYLTVLGRFAKK